MAPPWLSLDTLAHFYTRRPTPGCLLLAGPRRKVWGEVLDTLRANGRLKLTFCGYLYWWMIEGDPNDLRYAQRLIDLSLKPWRMPQGWMDAAAWDAQQGVQDRCFWTTPDGYRAKMAKCHEAILAVRNVQTEFSDGAHLEWMSDGFEWVLRRKAYHRRVRATFKAHGFRPRSAILNALRQVQASGDPCEP